MYRLTTREIATAALFTALLAVSSFAAVPVGSVPFTLQTYVVLLVGLVLGPRLGLLSTLSYLMLGLVAPVYSGGTSGLAALLGPTGGYLWGFLPAAVVAGTVARHRRRGLAGLSIAAAAGLLPVYLVGVPWLAFQLDLGPAAAVTAGIVPFVWIDLIKAVAAALTARTLVNLPLGLPGVSSPDR